jgi:hypothetical protein
MSIMRMRWCWSLSGEKAVVLMLEKIHSVLNHCSHDRVFVASQSLLCMTKWFSVYFEDIFVAELAVVLVVVMVSAPDVGLVVGCAPRRVGDAMSVGDGDLLPVAGVRFIVGLFFQVCGEQVVGCHVDDEVMHARPANAFREDLFEHFLGDPGGCLQDADHFVDESIFEGAAEQMVAEEPGLSYLVPLFASIRVVFLGNHVLGALEVVQMDDTGIKECQKHLESFRRLLWEAQNVLFGFFPAVCRVQRFLDETRVACGEIFAYSELLDSIFWPDMSFSHDVVNSVKWGQRGPLQ